MTRISWACPAALALGLGLTGCGGGGDVAPAPATSPPTSTTPTPTPTPTPPPTPGAGSPDAEVFALGDPGESEVSIQRYLAMPAVSGLAWRALWRALEPSDGAYDWRSLDAALNAAQAAGKRLTIHVGASGGAWPGWLTAAGAQTYAGSSPFGAVNDPIPWDPVYLARYGRFMQQMAEHIRGRAQMGVVKFVSVGAPVGEMSLAACADGVLGAAPNSVPYRRADYRTAWEGTARTVSAAFPQVTVFVSAPVTQICRPDADGAAFYSDVMNPLTASVPNLAVFAADLNAEGSQRRGLVAANLRTLPLGFQTIWSFTNDPTNRMRGPLSAAVCSGRGFGARYFEIYKSDLDSADPAVTNAIAQARGATPCA